MDERQIGELLESRLKETDLILVELKLTPGKLTVVVDRPGGISLAQCSEVNRFLLENLEPAGFTESREIEVTSPGPDRPLRDYRQFQARIGRRLHVVLRDGTERTGRVVEADEHGFALETSSRNKKIKTRNENNETALRLDFKDVKEARVTFTANN